LPNREKPANLLMQSLLFHVSIHEGCDRQPLEMTRIHFQSGSKEEVRTLALDPNPKGKLKDLGGSRSDKWNKEACKPRNRLIADRSF
jgi:hypothetical protein